MGRMFRIITDGSAEFPAAGVAAVVVSDDFVAGGVPFIEVGGPAGPVHSLPRPTPRAVAAPETIKLPLPNRPAVTEPGYLSVALHHVAAAPAAPVGVHSDVVAFHHPAHPVSAEYRGLAADLRKQVGTDGAKAVLFASAGAGSGTTTVLLNLAVTLAAESRVLVIDADTERPGAAKRMGLTDIPGLAEVLARTLPLAWALQPTAVPNLQLLAAGKPTPETPVAMSADFPRVVAQLRQWFDWVLIDGGVWADRPLRDGTAPACDGVYLVTRQADLDRPAVLGLRAQVAKHGGLLRGYVTTRA